MPTMNTYPIWIHLYTENGMQYDAEIDIEVGIRKGARSHDPYEPHDPDDLYTGEWTLGRVYRGGRYGDPGAEKVPGSFLNEWGFLLWQAIEDEIELNPDVCEELYEVVAEDWGWDDDDYEDD